MPLYLEIVDNTGKSYALPLPPYTTSGTYNVDDLISQTTEKAKTGTPGNYASSLKLLINPSTLNINMSKIINRTQAMTGWIEEHWGEELDTLTFQGYSAAFVSGGLYTTYDAGKLAPQTTAANTAGYNLPQAGLTSTENRRNSLSYNNMRAMVNLFSTNGIVYDPYGFVAKRYYIQLTYDFASYRGYFESFDITEESSNPFRFNYTVTFKVEKTMFRLGTKKWDSPKPQEVPIEVGGGTFGSLMAALLAPTAITEGPTPEEASVKPKPDPAPTPKPPPDPRIYLDVVTANGIQSVASEDFRNPDNQRSDYMKKEIPKINEAITGHISNQTDIGLQEEYERGYQALKTNAKRSGGVYGSLVSSIKSIFVPR